MVAGETEGLSLSFVAVSPVLADEIEGLSPNLVFENEGHSIMVVAMLHCAYRQA